MPAVPVVDLAAQFTPPFRVVERSECGDLDGNNQVTIDEVVSTVNGALSWSEPHF